MAEDDGWVGIHAAEGLIWNGHAEEVRELFSKKIPVTRPKYRIGVWRVLAQAAASSDERQGYVERIRAAFRETDGVDRGHAVETLAKLGDGRRSQARLTLASGNDALAAYARWGLVHGGGIEDEQHLAELLESGNPPARRVAAYALRHLPWLRQQTLDRLRKAAEGEAENSIGKVYMLSAVFVHSAEVERESARERLTAHAIGRQTPQKYELCCALGRAGTGDCGDLLWELFDDADLDVRVAAASALLQMDRRLSGCSGGDSPSSSDGILQLKPEGDDIVFLVGGKKLGQLVSPRAYSKEHAGYVPLKGITISREHEATVLRGHFLEDVYLELAFRRENGRGVSVEGFLKPQRNVSLGPLTLPWTIPLSFSLVGGSWACEDVVGTFPLGFGKTVLCEGKFSRLQWSDGRGHTLRFLFDPQTIRKALLQDNRRWHWPVFECQVQFEWDGSDLKASQVYPVHMKIEASSSAGGNSPIIDRFGQFRGDDWVGKVRNALELKNDVVAEGRLLHKLIEKNQRRVSFDRYGGLAGSGRRLGFRVTGYFHCEKVGDRWYIVDPEGNAFFSLGVCALTLWDTFTTIAGKEDLFEYLPNRDDPDFADAWIETPLGQGFSFQAVNLARKYGPDIGPPWKEQAGFRLRAWGFNTVGAFGGRLGQMPYVAWRIREAVSAAGRVIPNTSYSGSVGIVDVFEKNFGRKLDKSIEAMVTPLKDDPLLLGYFLGNEEFWHDLPDRLTVLGGDWAAKRQMVTFLRGEFAELEVLHKHFSFEGQSWDEIADEPLRPKTRVGREALRKFAGKFIERHFSMLTSAIRRHDPNHLILGNRFLTKTADDEQVMRIAAKYLDIISINYYTDQFEPDRLRRYYGLAHRPILLSEWSFGCAERGYSGGVRSVPDQDARGEAYTQYVSASADLPFVVGCHWFEYCDQSVTGRMNEGQDGERFNVGLIDVTDRPYSRFVKAVRNANLLACKKFASRPSRDSREE